MSIRLRSVLGVSTAIVVSACNGGPLVDGCRFAAGLTAKCDVQGGGRWYKPPAGFVVEELAGTAFLDSAAAALTREAERLADPLGPLGTRESIDALDLFMLTRHLFVYSDRGSVNDCIADGRRPAAITLVATRDASGNYPYLQFGPPSKLSSKAFESLFASSELKAKLEADLASVLPDAAEARAAADVAFSAMKQKLASDVALGTYRYLIVRSHPQVWSRMSDLGYIREECNGKSVSQGVVVVGLDKRDQLVERATGADFRAALSAVVDGARLNQAVATAEASLSAEIRRQSQRTIAVTLDSPAIVPLRWKPDRMR